MNSTETRLSPESDAHFEKMRLAHYHATRDALLEHARMGRSVVGSRDGVIYETPPAEIFARYGFDEFGRPLPGQPATEGSEG